jgi:signal transduction histidine kinase/ActR/RegA family two-component response regulator/PAS domain-containing protein
MAELINNDYELDKALLQRIPTGIGIYDVKDRVIEMKYLNDGYYQMIAVDSGNGRRFSGTEIIRTIHPDDREGLVNEAEAAIREKRMFQYRFRVLSGSGEYIWIGIRANHEPIGQGRERFYAAYYNVDKYLNEQSRLETDKKNIEEIISNIPGGVAVFSDRGGRIHLDYTNDGFFELHHGSREFWDTLSDDPVDWLLEEDRHIFEDEFKKVNGGEKLQGSVIYRVTGEDGGYHWVNNQFRKAYVDDGIQYYYAAFAGLDEQKEAERSRDEARRMYEAAVEDAKLVVWEYDITGHRVIMAENEFTRYDYRKFGMPKVTENVPGSLVKYIDENYVDAFLDMYARIEAGEPQASCEVWYKLVPDTEPRCERITYNTVYDEAGRPVRAFGLGQNITKQKLAEKKYEQAYKQLEEAHPLSLASFRINLTANWCGEGRSKLDFVLRQQESGTVDGYFVEFSKVIADEDIRRQALKMFDRKRLIEAFARGETKCEMEYPIEYSDGSRHWRNAVLFMLQNPKTGDIEGVTYAIDIDDTKRNSFIIRHLTGDKYDQIGLIHVRNHTYEFFSQKEAEQYHSETVLSYEKSCSYVRNSMIAPEDLEHFDHSVDLEVIIDKLHKNGSYATAYRRTIGGEISYVHVQYYWLEKPDDDILVFQNNITDTVIHEQEQVRRIKEALLEADKANEAKSVFLSSMSHDLRTPLNGVIAFTEFALKEEDPEKKQQYLERIRLSGRLLLDLVDDTLELSKIESGKLVLEPTATDTASLGMEVVTALRPAAALKHIDLIAAAEDFPDETIWVDKIKLQKIFLNLLSNAIKYTPQGGTVRCRVEVIDPPAAGRNRRIIVEDTGIGMGAEFMEKMFEPFSQEKRPESKDVSGTGLGLSIVKRYVDIMNGTVSVQSSIGEGTKFIVEIPVRKLKDVENSSYDEARDVAGLRGRRVLLCEDNYMNREIAEIMLKDKGIAVDYAENGQIGVEKFISSEIGHYDVILMDITMPVMDGMEATRKIRELNRPDAATVPVIAMTADAFEESAREALKSGMDEYLTKPIDPDKLLAALLRQTGRH